MTALAAARGALAHGVRMLRAGVAATDSGRDRALAAPLPPAESPATTLARELADTPLLWLLPLIAVQALVAAFEPIGLAPAIDWPLQAGVALLLIVGGGATIRAAAAELEWNATPVCVDEQARALVTTGPYRWSRHPMIAGATAVLAGVAFALGSALALGVVAAYAGWVDVRTLRREDAALHARFGVAWRAFAARTRRWF